METYIIQILNEDGVQINELKVIEGDDQYKQFMKDLGYIPSFIKTTKDAETM